MHNISVTSYPRHKPLLYLLTLLTILSLLHLVPAVDITLSVSISPFALPLLQTCTAISAGFCCEARSLGHLGYYWAGLQVSGLPGDGEAFAFHAGPPYSEGLSGCSGPSIGHGFGPGLWTWGNPGGLPRIDQRLSGGMWYNGSHSWVRESRNSSLAMPPRCSSGGQLPLGEGTQSREGVVPDVIEVDGDNYVDYERNGVYRDGYGRPYSLQQIMSAANVNEAGSSGIRTGSQTRVTSAL